MTSSMPLRAALVTALLVLPHPAAADPPRPVPVQTVRTVPTVHCHMAYSLRGWSVFYKRAKGTGVITCDNGQSARVRLSVHGGGLTFGKSEIVDGSGRFTDVRSIDELFGDYASAGAHGGAGRAGGAQAMSKGEVSLTLTGTGRGVDVGVDFSKFSIEPMVG
jgi:hypothetical protein